MSRIALAALGSFIAAISVVTITGLFPGTASADSPVRIIGELIRNNKEKDRRLAAERLNQLAEKVALRDAKKSQLDAAKRALAQSDDPEMQATLRAMIERLEKEIRRLEEEIREMTDDWGKRGRKEVIRLIDSELAAVQQEVDDLTLALVACEAEHGGGAAACESIRQELKARKEYRDYLKRLRDIVSSKGESLACEAVGADSGEALALAAPGGGGCEPPTLLELLLESRTTIDGMEGAV